MSRCLCRFGFILWICTIPACASKVFTFKTTSPATVDLLTAAKLDDPGKELGKTPLTVDLKQLQGNIVRISQPGKIPVYWVVAEAAGDTTEATVKLLDAPQGSAAANPAATDAVKADPRASINRVLRLLLQAYQALSGRRFQAARELAEQAAAIDPELAAPQLIKGLSLYQEGKLAEARTSLQKAQALDPEDKNIDELLKVIR